MKSDNGNSVTHKDVIVIGNGPSGIALSYMLAGNVPYVTSNDHPDEMLSARLSDAIGESLIKQDLEFLSNGLEGRSTNPISLLLDSLTHPCADIGLEIDPLVEWRKNGVEIDHIVFGKGPPGGSWHTMDPHILTLSLGTWMSLPGYKYTTRDTAEKRAFAHNVAKYYEQYVNETGLAKYFSNGTIVTNIKELEDARESTDMPEKVHEVCPNNEKMEFEKIEEAIEVKQSNCPIANALSFLLRSQRRLKIDRCCKRKLDCTDGKNAKSDCTKLLEDSSLNGGDVSSDILLQKNRFKKMNLNCDKNRSVSFSCDYDSLKRSGASVYNSPFGGESLTFFNFLRSSCNLDVNRIYKKVPGEIAKSLPNTNCDPTTSKVQVQRKDNKPRWLIEVYDVKTKRASKYTCNSLVLANGASDLPNRLAIGSGRQDPSWLLHDVRSLEIELELYMQQCTGVPDPVLVVGAGLSAADAIIATRGKNVPVLHMFRNKSRDLNKQLPENMYPEYHKVHQMMQSSTPYSLYTALPEHTLTNYSEEKRTVTLMSVDGKEVQYQVSFVVVLIGSRPDLGFLPRDFKIGINQNMVVDSKTNPINIDKLRHSVRGYKELYAMGPIAGDHFVRFLPGGALAIVADLYKKYGY